MEEFVDGRADGRPVVVNIEEKEEEPGDAACGPRRRRIGDLPGYDFEAANFLFDAVLENPEMIAAEIPDGAAIAEDPDGDLDQGDW
ncbi:MAG: hypothetical protein MZV64_11530 [Ignavibacteriales bacterium]|nr:hypothetical protein [Ignavibacteriales bacterium]MCK7518300.1 hypothetical protein [Ignavibacteriales bacterium]